MNIRLDLYTAIKTQLETITLLSKVGTVEHVAIWNSQTLQANADNREPFAFPMVFIEFERSNYREPKQQAYNTNIRGEQNKDQNITLHIWTDSLKNSTNAFTDKEDLIEQIKYKLKGIDGTNYSPLKLISDEYEVDHDRLFESQLIFTCLVQESGVYDNQVDANDTGVNPDAPVLPEVNSTFSNTL